jgi:hypothetical protein
MPTAAIITQAAGKGEFRKAANSNATAHAAAIAGPNSHASRFREP